MNIKTHGRRDDNSNRTLCGKNTGQTTVEAGGAYTHLIDCKTCEKIVDIKSKQN